jgi:hypothetical protein
MTSSRWLALSFALAAVGCVPDEGTPTLGSTQAAITADNKISANKISANKISANKISANKISANKISANKISANMLAAGDLLATSDGRDVYAYLVSCALPASQTLEAVVDGVTYDFAGSIGLASDWIDRALTDREQAWVSACMIARVNAYDISVQISMRGDHDALGVTPAEAAAYTLEEGAFYGDIFTPDTQPIVWVACRGRAQAHGETGGLIDRDCTEPAGNGVTMCGFTYAGDCGDFNSTRVTPYACRDNEDGFYEKCHDQPGVGAWPTAATFKQVITVFVQP